MRKRNPFNRFVFWMVDEHPQMLGCGAVVIVLALIGACTFAYYGAAIAALVWLLRALGVQV
jgi:hypothetical protein